MKTMILFLALGVNLALAYDFKTCSNLVNRIEKQYTHQVNAATRQKQYADNLAYNQKDLDESYDITNNFGKTKSNLTEYEQSLLTSKALEKGSIYEQKTLNNLKRRKQLDNQLLQNQIEYQRALDLAESERQYNYNEIAIECEQFLKNKIVKR